MTSHQPGKVRWWHRPTTSSASVTQIGTSSDVRPSRFRCPCCSSSSFTEEICHFTAQLLRWPRQNQGDGILWTMQLQWHHCLQRQPRSHRVCLRSHGRISLLPGVLPVCTCQDTDVLTHCWPLRLPQSIRGTSDVCRCLRWIWHRLWTRRPLPPANSHGNWCITQFSIAKNGHPTRQRRSWSLCLPPHGLWPQHWMPVWLSGWTWRNSCPWASCWCWPRSTFWNQNRQWNRNRLRWNPNLNSLTPKLLLLLHWRTLMPISTPLQDPKQAPDWPAWSRSTVQCLALPFPDSGRCRPSTSDDDTTLAQSGDATSATFGPASASDAAAGQSSEHLAPPVLRISPAKTETKTHRGPCNPCYLQTQKNIPIWDYQ